jgi:branched-subunit amino acid aminotransferase/4-amino-4-deoxychorismate lyase
MTSFGEFYRFVDGTLVASNQATDAADSGDAARDDVKLGAADSWLVEDGRVRSLQLHFERFGKAVANLSPQIATELPAFYEAVIALTPVSGRWFPRIEFHAELAVHPLFLRLREAPAQLGPMVLYTLEEPDPRVNPTVKGPDLSLGMQLRRKAIVHGADEAVLVTADGFISEGALSALVWWQGDVLCAPNLETPWIDSVTRREVFDIAKALGLDTRLVKARPADLAGLEVWGLSSLHGIRPVADWVNLGAPVGGPLANPGANSSHLETFQRRLKMLAGPMTTKPAPVAPMLPVWNN